MKPGILLGHLKNVRNEGLLIRTAECFGINLVLNFKDQKEYAVSRKTDKHMIFIKMNDVDSFLKYCYDNNHSIVCLENIGTAVSLQNAEYPANPVFVTGNENTGVPKEILERAKLVVKIPQAFSYCKCLNTSIACSIVINDWFQKNQVLRNYQWKT